MNRSILHTLTAGAAVGLAGACGPLAPPGGPTPRAAAAFADSITSTTPFDRAHWGIQVVDATSGRVLYRHQAERHFRPASNTKLVVTATALGLLGPDHRYRTPVYAVGHSPGDTVADAIVLVGRGDPTWSERFHPTDFAPLDSLADSVAAAGIRRIAGDVIIDATYFDSVSVNPTWEVGDLPWYYAAPVAAFGVGEAAFPVEISPGAATGESAVHRVLVPRAVAPPVVNALVTDTAGADDDIDAARDATGDTIVLAGTVPLDEAPDTAWLAVLEPVRYGGRAFARALEARGIEVEGDVRVLYDEEDADVAGAVVRSDAGLAGEPAPLVVWTSPPISAIVAAVLQPSQNWIAEQLLKTLGAEFGGRGSWREGLAVEERYLIDVVGIDSTAFHLRDGSGLSAQNLITPGAVVRLLAHARTQPWGAAYRRALAAPALEESTLEDRLLELEGRLAAKTGTIAHVNALSGYLVTERGRDRIFSVLTDASGLPSWTMREAIDRIVRTFADGGERP